MEIGHLRPDVPVEASARALAHDLLADDPRRLMHVAGAARIARFVGRRLRIPHSELIVSAAWVHDIGYVSALRRTGFHPVDGAQFLQDHGWPRSVVELVAYHSHGVITAPFYEADEDLAVFAEPDALWLDVLTLADVTAGVDGHGATLEERLADLRERQARNGRVPAEARERRYDLLTASVKAVVAALVAEGPSTEVHQRQAGRR